MTNQSLTKVRSITLYYQTAAETGGDAGWAYNVISTDGDHTSDGFSVSDDDDGSESLSDVRTAFAAEWPEAYAQIPLTNWRAMPEGGWTGTRR
jgi:hypothetical protein